MRITGKVSLSPALAGKVAPTDTVFILARAAQGPKMPLAVLRTQVKDLPVKFTLDDSMAMQPQLKLSGFDQVVVVARVSKSGTPMAQSGDLQGLTGTVKPGHQGLEYRDRQRRPVTVRSAVGQRHPVQRPGAVFISARRIPRFSIGRMSDRSRAMMPARLPVLEDLPAQDYTRDTFCGWHNSGVGLID